MKLSKWILEYQKENDYPDLVLAQDWALRATKLEAELERQKHNPPTGNDLTAYSPGSFGFWDNEDDEYYNIPPLEAT